MKTPEEYHWAEHQRFGVDFEECWSCGRALAQCRRKVKFADSWMASDRARELNVDNGFQPCLKAYHCRWCLFWHLTSKTNTFRNTPQRKEMRTWMIERELRRRGQAQDL